MYRYATVAMTVHLPTLCNRRAWCIAHSIVHLTSKPVKTNVFLKMIRLGGPQSCRFRVPSRPRSLNFSLRLRAPAMIPKDLHAYSVPSLHQKVPPGRPGKPRVPEADTHALRVTE
jgi:hypothetical protein